MSTSVSFKYILLGTVQALSAVLSLFLFLNFLSNSTDKSFFNGYVCLEYIQLSFGSGVVDGVGV